MSIRAAIVFSFTFFFFLLFFLLYFFLFLFLHFLETTVSQEWDPCFSTMKNF